MDKGDIYAFAVCIFVLIIWGAIGFVWFLNKVFVT